MRVTPTSGHLGAVVTGVDLSTVTADELAGLVVERDLYAVAAAAPQALVASK